MSDAIRISKAATKKPKPKASELGFGSVFTDHMFVMDFQEEKGWYDPRVEPYGPFSLDPATAVLHYGQGLFEGLKAFRGRDGKIRLFRPDKHVERLNLTAERMCIPALDPEMVLKSWTTVVDIDRDWVPSSVGTSLYIRPTIIASEPFLGVRPAKEYLYFVILSPVGAYYPEGMNQVKIKVIDDYVRAVPGQDLGELRGQPLRRRGGQARGLHPGAVAGRCPPAVHRGGGHHEHHDEDRRRGDHPAAGRHHPGRGYPGLGAEPHAPVGSEGVRAAGHDRRGAGGGASRNAQGGLGHRHRGRHLAGRRARLQGRAHRHQRGRDRRAHPAALRRHRRHPVR